MTGTITPTPIQTLLDNNGDPVSLGRVFTYVSGTTTKLPTYTDATLATPNSNPIVTDTAGRYTAFLGPYSYKFVAAPPGVDDPPSTTYWTVDGLQAVPQTNVNVDIPGVAGQDLAANDAVYLSDGSGALTAGRWYKTSSTNAYSSSASKEHGFAVAAITTGSTGAIRQTGRVEGLAGLVAGTVYYAAATAGTISSTSPANSLPVGVADSTTTLIVPASIPDASTTVSGLMNISAQAFTGVKTFTAPALTGGGSWTGSPSLTSPDFVAMPTGIGGTIFNRVTSTATVNNSTTLVNISGMSFAVVANGVYTFCFVIMGATTSTVSDWKFAVTGPAAPTSIRYGAKNNQAPNQIVLSSFTSWTVQGYAGTTEEVIVINGVLANGANAGTVQLQFAQAVANASNTTISVNSHVIAMRTS